MCIFGAPFVQPKSLNARGENVVTVDDATIRGDAVGGAAGVVRQFEGDWNGLVGRRIEIYDRGILTDSGTVDAVTPDGQVLWLAQEGVYSRRIHERSSGRVVHVPRQQESRPHVERPVRQRPDLEFADQVGDSGDR